MIVMLGTEVVIRVRNHQLLNSLTLHAHGLDNEWFQDGEAYLQQCPIPVRSEFVYRFMANVQGTMILRAAFPFYSPIR
jgi:FtsP/CotA-like multicopper oxidase with cupredoxin domain